MTGFNTQFSAECISLLNLVMALSSSVQFKSYVCNQVNDFAGNEDSPTKQARGDSGKKRKTPSVTEWRKNLGRKNQAQSGGQFPLRPDESVVCSNCSKVQNFKWSTGSRVFSWWLSRWRVPHWASVSGAHLCVLDSADGQGCRGCRGCL